MFEKLSLWLRIQRLERENKLLREQLEREQKLQWQWDNLFSYNGAKQEAREHDD